MRLQLVILCLLSTLIAANPPVKSFEENGDHASAIQKFEVIGKVLRKFFQRSTDIQQLASTKSHELQKSLATFGRGCSVKQSRDIEINRKLLLVQYYNCSILGILEDFASLGIDSAEYVYATYKDTSLIAADIAACTTIFNPFNFIYCIVKAASVIPTEFKQIITQTKEFIKTLQILIPSIDHGIDACFHKSSSFYNKYVDEVLEKAKLCDKAVKIFNGI